MSHSFAAGGGWTGRRLYRPTGFLDPRNGSNRGGRESGGEGSVTGTGSLPTRFLRFLYRTGEQVRPPLSFFFANRFENRDAPREKRGGARINRFFDFSATNGPNATRKRERGGWIGLVIGLHRTGESESGWSIDKALLGRAWESSLPCSPPARSCNTRREKIGGKKKRNVCSFVLSVQSCFHTVA